MRKLLDSLENAQKAWVDLKKDAKGAHKLFKDYQPEEDLVKREKIIYTGSVKDFVRLTLPILDDQRFRVNGQTNREAMIRALDEVFEIHPNGCPESRSFRSILSTAQEEYASRFSQQKLKLGRRPKAPPYLSGIKPETLALFLSLKNIV